MNRTRTQQLTIPGEADTKRAQRAAALADAKTKEIRDSNEREVHHLINAAAAQAFPDLLTAAARTGWIIDEPANVITLPANETARGKLAAKGIFLPLHDNGHPVWNRDVARALADLRQLAFKTHGRLDSPAKDIFIRWRIEVLQQVLRAKIAMLSRVVENGSTPPAPDGSG